MSRPSIEQLIAAHAPPRPKCFSSDTSWHSWLADAHRTDVRIVERVFPTKAERRAGKPTYYRFIPVREINYCAECPTSYRLQMQREGRCEPCDVMKQEPRQCSLTF